jgi:alcohol dehydrogenase
MLTNTIESTVWNYPTEIRFGVGRREELDQILDLLGSSRPLIVTDRGISSLPFFEGVLTKLESSDKTIRTYDRVLPDPTETDVDNVASTINEHRADAVVVIGGGSVIDAGKVGTLLHSFDIRFRKYSENNKAMVNRLVPIIAIPTTAGTGSEVGRAAAVLIPDEQRKAIVFNPQMMPKMVILDPEVTVGLPPNLTAWTGFDTLSHNLEALCAKGNHPIADGIATEAIRLLLSALPHVYRDGKDLQFRAQMQVAATMGGCAFQKGLGAVHALSHVIGARYKTHHGLTNAVLMPYVLEYNRPLIDGLIARLAGYVGLESDYSAFLLKLLILRADLGIPNTLADLGVATGDLRAIAIDAVKDSCAQENPRDIQVENALQILQAALSGHLGKLK